MTQDWEPILPGKGAGLVDLLVARTGKPYRVELEDGSTFEAYDCAWGRDFGEEWEHLTFNCSPPAPERDIHFVLSPEIVRVTDAATGETIYARAV